MYHVIYNLENMFANLEDCRFRLSNLVLTPRIPSHRMPGEDNITPRVCVGETIEDCITGIGIVDAFSRCCKPIDSIDCGCDNDNNCEAYPIAVIELPDDLPYYKPSVLEVPDVDDTGEYWLLEPAIPVDIRICWLDAYSIDYFCPNEFSDLYACDRVWFVDDLKSYNHPWLNGKGHTLSGRKTGVLVNPAAA